MKIKKIEKKLILKKNTVAHLNGNVLKKVLGGRSISICGTNSGRTNCPACM